MDRRSWLWRRKSLDTSPGETESSGSLSSHSERFFDDQAYINHNTQSPEVSSKVAPAHEALNDNEKTLSEKLSGALLNISAKEDLVKQHAKVAEEAISGWEKAENEVLTLKQQLEAVTQKNSGLEDRVSHLDGALKECLRQLRQAREEQEQKIDEAVVKKEQEWQRKKSIPETQVFELQAKSEAAKTKAVISVDPDLRPKLRAAEKEITDLKQKVLAQGKELEVRAIERDFSTQAAESASKQLLESIKKGAKLEAECHRLKTLARKAATDHKSCTASSNCVESFTDSQSDCGERLLSVDTGTRKISGIGSYEYEVGCSDSWASSLIAELGQFKNGKAPGRNPMAPSVEMNLMYDFLEMEKLVALPETESRSGCVISEAGSSQINGGGSPPKSELETMVHHIAELEEELEKVEEEKVKLEMALTESQEQLQASQGSLEEAGLKLMELQNQVALANETNRTVVGELQAIKAERETVDTQISVLRGEINSLLSKVGILEEEAEKEKVFSASTMNKCRELANELSKLKLEANYQHATMTNGESKIKQEKELRVAASKLSECQKTIASLGQQLKSLATLEEFMTDSEKDEPSASPNEGLKDSNNQREPWKLHSSDLSLRKVDSETPRVVSKRSNPPRGNMDSRTTVYVDQLTVAEKSRNGLGKLFSRSKGGS